ncbi:MAG: hypothetical protein RIT27_2158 [Pseudomonadota bacterium]|jgi:SanA protein
MFQKILSFSFAMLIIVFLSMLISDYWITSQTQARLYNKIAYVPTKEIGLVLGTRKTLDDGQINVYFSARIEAAALLIKHHKVNRLLLSGARYGDFYDELKDMQEDLLKLGVLPNQIMIDNNGFRTLDSIRNAKDIFKVNDVIIISQAFHNQRALFLGDFYGLQAIGFNANDPYWSWQIKTRIREYFARVRAFVDVFLG